MGENASATTGVKRRRWLRWPIPEGAAVVAVLAVVAWLWPTPDPPPLNEEEQRFVGRWAWESIGRPDGGNTRKSEELVRPERTMDHSAAVTDPRERRAAVNKGFILYADWRIDGGRLTVTEWIPRRGWAGMVPGRRYEDNVPPIEFRLTWDGPDRVTVAPTDPRNERIYPPAVWTRVRDGSDPVAK